MLLNGKCRFIFQIVISILCSPVILVEYLLVSCKSKGLLHTAFSILCAPICLLQYLLGVVLKSSKSHQKRLPIEKQKTLLLTGASIQGMYIFLLKHLFILVQSNLALRNFLVPQKSSLRSKVPYFKHLTKVPHKVYF